MNRSHRLLAIVGAALVVLALLLLLIAGANDFPYPWYLFAAMTLLTGIGVLALHLAVKAVLKGDEPRRVVEPVDRSDRVPDRF